MASDRDEFLNLLVKPAAIGYRESGFITGLSGDGLIFLEKEGHFKAMANPPPGAQRYFFTSYVLKIAQDEKWMTRAVRLIRENTRRRNQAKQVRRRNQQMESFDLNARLKHNK